MSVYTGSGILLALATGTALTLASPPAFGTPPSGGGGGGPLSITAFPRDYLIYDSGGAVGLNYATIPVSGTGPIGFVIEARAVSTALSGLGTTAWTNIATVGAGGTYLGVLDVPLARPWLKLETRLQAAPTTVAQTANRFAVGMVAALWGQSEKARCWLTNIDTLPIPALTTIKDQVLNLANPGQSGRTSRNILNVASAGNLPPGGSLTTSNVITISGTRTIEDWSFTDFEVRIPSGAVIALKQCRFIATDSGTHNYMVQARVGGRATIDDCDFVGPSSQTNLAAAVKEEQTSIGQYGKTVTTRCRVTGLPADGFKLVAGSIFWTYGKWVKNTDAVGPINAWSSLTLYNTGDHVVYNSNIFRSANNGNLNNTPPSTKTDNAFWLNVDPHVDCVTVEKADEPVFLEYCFFDMSELVLANGGTGAVNNIRWAPVTGSSAFLNSHVRYCAFNRDPNSPSVPFQVTPEYLGQVYLTGCWYTPRSAGGNQDVYPSNEGNIHWAGMKSFYTNTPRPAVEGQIDEDISFVEENNDYCIQQVHHNRAVDNSGAAGVIHTMQTTATSSALTSSFRNMANVTLLELCGYKVCYLHQTMSGTGVSELFNDSNLGRYWNDDKAIHDYATAGGGTVGIAGGAWNAATGPLGLNLSIAFYELMTDKNWTTGVTMSKPYIYPTVSGSPQYTADRSWAELYNLSRTRYVFMGPHAGGGSIAFSDGTVDFTMRNYMRHSISHDTMMADARSNGVFAPRGPILYYKTGQTFGGGSVDYAHPNNSTVYGGSLYMSLIAHGFMKAAGFRQWPIPSLDQVYWDPAGAYVEVWSSQGDVTTMRKQYGWPDIPATFPHRTDVFGFEYSSGDPDLVNGTNLVPMQSARIVNSDGSGTSAISGRVRILKPTGGAWVSGDVLNYGLGGGGGTIAYPQDYDDDHWANKPVVMVGMRGPDGNAFGQACRTLGKWVMP